MGHAHLPGAGSGKRGDCRGRPALNGGFLRPSESPLSFFLSIRGDCWLSRRHDHQSDRSPDRFGVLRGGWARDPHGRQKDMIGRSEARQWVVLAGAVLAMAAVEGCYFLDDASPVKRMAGVAWIAISVGFFAMAASFRASSRPARRSPTGFGATSRGSPPSSTPATR
jgi:hypothetical protein